MDSERLVDNARALRAARHGITRQEPSAKTDWGNGKHAGFSSWLEYSGRNPARRAKKWVTGTGGSGPKRFRRTGRA